MVKPWSPAFLVIIGILASLIAAWFTPGVIDYINAPKFSKLKYVNTIHHIGCWAVITDDTCYTIYVYKATGSEAEIAKSVSEDLKRSNYFPAVAIDGSDVSVRCLGDTDNGRYGNIYRFDKNVKVEYPPSVDVSLFTPVNDNPDNYFVDAFGCSNQTGEFKVHVRYFELNG